MSETTTAKKRTRYVSRRLRDQAKGYSLKNKVELVESGRSFFELLKKLISHARHSIHLHTYIFGEDQTGIDVAEALMAAARRKVDVYMLVDGYASQKLSNKFQQQLKDAGVKFRFFEPFFKSKRFYFGRRLHHKIVVIDSCEALVGSMNIADKYNDTKLGRAWFDMALHIRGEVSEELERICIKFWEGNRWNWIRRKPVAGKTKNSEFPKDHLTPIRVRQNDWINRKGQATSSYYQLFHNAKRSVCVVCSYVLPGKTLRRQIQLAAKRGVKIEFVLAGTSDVRVVKAAERYLYRWMFRYGIKLYEYQATVLHTKMGLSDDEWMTIGSYNLNNLSAYASVELNLDVKDPVFVESVHERVSRIIEKECKPVDLELYTTHLFSLKQFSRWCAYQLTRLAEKLITKK